MEDGNTCMLIDYINLQNKKKLSTITNCFLGDVYTGMDFHHVSDQIKKEKNYLLPKAKPIIPRETLTTSLTIQKQRKKHRPFVFDCF